MYVAYYSCGDPRCTRTYEVPPTVQEKCRHGRWISVFAKLVAKPIDKRTKI